jgi:hypothetical protein
MGTPRDPARDLVAVFRAGPIDGPFARVRSGEGNANATLNLSDPQVRGGGFVSSNLVAQLRERGLTTDQILFVLECMINLVRQVETQPAARTVSAGALRTRRWRARKAATAQTSPRDGQTSPVTPVTETPPRDAAMSSQASPRDDSGVTEHHQASRGDVSSLSFSENYVNNSTKREKESVTERHKTSRGDAERHTSQGASPSPAASRRDASHGPLPLPADWVPTPDHFAAGAALGFNASQVIGQAEDMRLWAKAHGARKVDWDAAFSVWLRRNARSPPGAGGQLNIPLMRTMQGGGAAQQREEPRRNTGRKLP